MPGRPTAGARERTPAVTPPRRLGSVKPVLLIGHDENETFGLAPAGLGDRDLEALEHRSATGAELPPAGDVSGVIVFGGAMNVDMTDRYPFLAEERRYVRAAVDAGIPLLGICLGGQMLARAMGRRVYATGTRRLGFSALSVTPEGRHDPLLSVFDEGDMVFHWHEDTFELPYGADVLATGAEVRLQAFRIGDHAWGTQFHFEVDRPELELWLDAAGDDVVRAWGATREQLLADADRFLPEQERRARELFARFGDVIIEATAPTGGGVGWART
jgi:GMP synthase (glutamine-hydrolysing)